MLKPLYAAYGALVRAREARQPLDLDLPERRIVLSEDGQVTSVAYKDRLDAHRLIEEFMILANVAAARELERRKTPLLYRVHEEPAPEKLDALRETAQSVWADARKGPGSSRRHTSTGFLRAAEGTDNQDVIHMSTLALDAAGLLPPPPATSGTFGLAPPCGPTRISPRRSGAIPTWWFTARSSPPTGWGDDGFSAEEIERLEATAQHISETERRSMMAERDTTDRYLAAYLSERLGHRDRRPHLRGSTLRSVREARRNRRGWARSDSINRAGVLPFRPREPDPDGCGYGSDSYRSASGSRCGSSKPLRSLAGLILELLEIEGDGVARGPRKQRGRGPQRQTGPRRAQGAKGHPPAAPAIIGFKETGGRLRPSLSIGWGTLHSLQSSQQKRCRT